MNSTSSQNDSNFIQRILAKYTYQSKLNFIAILITGIIIFITYLLIANLQQELEFTQHEIQGTRYQKIIYELINAITKDKIQPSEDSENKIENAFSNLINFNSQPPRESEINFENFQSSQGYLITPKEIYDTWKKPVDFTSESKAIHKNHALIIDNLQNLLMHVGDQSNLTYDPNITTHYFIESITRFLPEEQDLISRILYLIKQNEDKENVSPETKFEITTLATLLLSNTFETENSIEKSIHQEVNDHISSADRRELNNQVTDYVNTVESFVKYAETSIIHLNTESPVNSFQPFFKSPDNLHKESLSLAEFTSLGLLAIEKNRNLWITISDRVENLFQIRLSDIKRQQTIILSIVSISLLFALGMGYVIVSEMNRFFRNVHKAVINFSKGDLETRIPVSYDRSFEKIRVIGNELGDRIEALIGQLQKAGVQLTITTTEIAAAAKHQEGTVCQQEATVKQILITAGEISSTAKEFAKTMNDVSSSSERTSELASSGKQGLAQMENTIRLMVDASRNIASKLAVLNEKAGTITGVITTITKIADQTNMLSLNASIEAEKAGEHGKSFAVIAREIRRLADKTANSTLDIEKMVSEMISAVTEGVVSVDKFSEEIRTGVYQVSKVSEQLSSIISQVQQQTINFEYVNRGMQTQSVGAEQINESIMELSDAAQQTTISIRQFHTAIEQLTAASKEMQACVARMKNSYISTDN